MTLAASVKTPQVTASILFGGSGASLLAAPKRILLIGSMIVSALTATVNLPSSATESIAVAAGTAAVNAAVQAQGADHAAALAGRGSELHLAVVAALAQYRGAEVWIAPVAYGSSPVAASATLTPTVSTLAAGTVRLTVCGRSVDVPVTAADTPSTLGIAFARAINAQRDWPVTASNTYATGATVLTAKCAGPRGNAIAVRAALLTDATTIDVLGTAKTAFGLTLTWSGGAADGGVYRLASGAVDDSNATLLAAIATQKFDRIGAAIYRVSGAVTANAGRLRDALLAQDAASMFDQQAVFGSVADPATANTDASAGLLASTPTAALNDPRCGYFNSPGSEHQPLEIAAVIAAARLFGDGQLGGAQGGETESPAGPACNLNGLELALNAPFSLADLADAAEVEGNLNHGVSPVALSPTRSGKLCLVASIQTRAVANGVADFSVYKTKDVTVADYARAFVLGELRRVYRGYNLVADEPSGRPPRAQKTVSPSIVRAFLYQLCKRLERDGVLTDVDKTKAQITAVRNASNNRRVDFTFPSIPPSDLDIQAGTLFQQQSTDEV